MSKGGGRPRRGHSVPWALEFGSSRRTWGSCTEAPEGTSRSSFVPVARVKLSLSMDHIIDHTWSKGLFMVTSIQEDRYEWYADLLGFTTDRLTWDCMEEKPEHLGGT